MTDDEFPFGEDKIKPSVQPCGCDESWTCPEHRGLNIPTKTDRRKISIPPEWKGFVEGIGVMGVLFLVLKIMENWK